MPGIELASGDMSFIQRLTRRVNYPARGSGLATCVAPTLFHCIASTPSSVGDLAGRIFHDGLLAVGLLNQHPDERTQASLLLERIVCQQSDFPQRTKINSMRSQLTGIT